jgi:hypothetical protein
MDRRLGNSKKHVLSELIVKMRTWEALRELKGLQPLQLLFTSYREFPRNGNQGDHKHVYRKELLSGGSSAAGEELDENLTQN